jgi:hypothetical protein
MDRIFLLPILPDDSARRIKVINRWNQGLRAAISYATEHGHTRVNQNTVHEGVNIGSTVLSFWRRPTRFWVRKLFRLERDFKVLVLVPGSEANEFRMQTAACRRPWQNGWRRCHSGRGVK